MSKRHPLVDIADEAFWKSVKVLYECEPIGCNRKPEPRLSGLVSIVLISVLSVVSWLLLALLLSILVRILL